MGPLLPRPLLATLTEACESRRVGPYLSHLAAHELPDSW
jgi:hypothetical protein